MLQSREQAIEFIKGVPDDRLHYVIMLLNYIHEGVAPDKLIASATVKSKKLGGMEGKIWMSEDFNEPLECFKEYMP